MPETNPEGASLSRGIFLLPFGIGATLTAAACVASSYLQVRLRMMAVRDELLWMGVPGVAVALVWITLWRLPLRHIGRASNEPRNERVERGIFAGVMTFWLAACALQVGLHGVLTERSSLPDVTTLRKTRPTRIVEIQHFDFDRTRCVWEWDTWNPSRGSSDVNVGLHVACPFQAGNGEPWLAWRHSERVAQRKLKDNDERAELSRLIADRTNIELRDLPQKVTYFERIATDRTARLLAAKIPRDAPLLLAKTEPYEARGFGFLVASGILSALLFGLLLFVPIERGPASPDVSDAQAGTRGRFGLGATSPWRLLIPGAGMTATPLLLYVNVGVFAAMVVSGVDAISPSPESLVNWGAIQGELVSAGDWWRLLTYQFVHGGIVHLFMNGLVLLLAGLLLELTAGAWWTLFAYVAGGVAGGLASVGWQVSTSVGASGAILSIVGALVTVSYGGVGLGPRVGTWAIGIGLLNILGGLKVGVDGAAHAGGFAAGLAVGAIFYLVTRRRRSASPDQPSADGEERA